MNASRLPFAAALMAGGRSRRMGTDKAFLSWHGEPLWCYQRRKLESLGPSGLYVSARPDQGFPSDTLVITDQWPDCGPLGGIASVLSVCHVPRLLVLGVDLPLLPVAALNQLLEAAGAVGGAVFRHADGAFEPLAAIYPASLSHDARARVEDGQLAVQDFVRKGVRSAAMAVLTVPENENWFLNLNTPDDWQAADFKT